MIKDVLDEIADGLNELLKVDPLDQVHLQKLYDQLIDIPEVRFKIMDFVFYDEKNLKTLTEEKIKQIRLQNFELVANARNQEKECIKNIKFKKYFKLQNSFFYPEEDKLFYFYLGTARNDKVIKALFTEPKED